MASQTSSLEKLQFGTFTLGSQLFGVHILQMREIIRPIEVTKVPKATDIIEGVINLRGEVIPIVSLRARFGMPPKSFDKETRIINIDIENIVVGFIVDTIGHVHTLDQSTIEQPPAVVASVDSEYISGIAKLTDRLLILLNVEKLVPIETLQSFVQQA